MKTADKGARLGNVIVDTILVLIFMQLLSIILYLIPEDVAEDYIIAFSIYPAVAYVGYHFFFEYVLGKTPGKFLTRTKVVDERGNKPLVGRLLIRTVLRLVPYDTVSFLFGFIGLHDSISKTFVVEDRDKE